MLHNNRAVNSFSLFNLGTQTGNPEPTTLVPFTTTFPIGQRLLILITSRSCNRPGLFLNIPVS